MTRINKRKKVFKLKLPFMLLCVFGIFVIGIFTYSFGNLRFEKTIDIVSGALHKLSGSNRITYNSLGGSSCSEGSYTPGSPLSGLCQPTLSGYTFAGWVDENHVFYYDGKSVDDMGELDLIASWIINDNVICKRATRLHTSLCGSSTSHGCRSIGYTAADYISYGNIVTNGKFNFGDAYDCDVDGDGIYDSENERFYYVTDLENNNDVAVLIYSKNVKAGYSVINTAYKWFTSNVQTSGPATAAAQLPTTEQWPNVSLQYPVRDILDNSGAVKKSEFDYSLYSARLLTYDEVLRGSGLTSITTTGDLNNYTFLFENTNFDLSTSASKYGYWLETGNTSNALVYNVNGRNRDVTTIAETNANYAVRPAIEVPKNKISNLYNDNISIYYMNNGGSGCFEKKVVYQNQIGELCTPVKTGYTFIGWYDETGNEVTSDTIIDNPNGMNVYAMWRANTVCRRATTLSTTTCSSNSSYGCRKQGMASGAAITYGDGTISDHLLTGNPLICDVNGDNIFDETLERFYYVTDLEGNNDVAVLVSSNNFTGGVAGSTTLYKYYTSNNQTYGPVTAMAQLPTTTQWPTVSLSSPIRNIVSDNGTLKKEGFSYEGYAARFLTYDEVNRGCGITLKNTAGILDNCSFLLENTQYQASSGKANNYWLETATSANTTGIWYIQGTNRYGYYQNASSTAAVRPAIEVNKDNIDLNPVLYIVYDGAGGTGCDHKLYQSGVAVGDLCIPYRDDYSFTGWYDEEGNLVTSNSVFTCNNDDYSGCTKTLTATWEKMLRVKQSWKLTYTGEPQVFTIPYDGIYKIQVEGGGTGGSLWGADNGSGYSIDTQTYEIPGYAEGQFKFNINQDLYVYVGGKGGYGRTGSYAATGKGGWNGGLTGNSGCSGSGGATHVSLTNELYSAALLDSGNLLISSQGGAGSKTSDQIHKAKDKNGGGSNYVNTSSEYFVGGDLTIANSTKKLAQGTAIITLLSIEQ